jgi:hypothetical protein
MSPIDSFDQANMNAQMSTKTIVVTGKFAGVSPVMTAAIKPQMIARQSSGLLR